MGTQQEYLDCEGACKCLIHHPLDPDKRRQAEEVMRTGKGVQVAIAAQMLSGCPMRMGR